jgi:hypothetical protein
MLLERAGPQEAAEVLLADMGLTMSQRKAVAKATATLCRPPLRVGKARVLDELSGLTGWP